jgi:hypothetical protein
MAHGTDREFEPIDALRRIPFVRDLHYAPAPDGQDLGYDGKIDVRTPAGHFHLLVEAKRSFLTRSAVNQLLAWVKQVGTGKPHQVILLARHIPRPVAERLIEAQVNFADDVGNIHLALGDRYNWTVVGKPALEPVSERRPISAAQLQLLFQFVTHPDSANWPVRRLALASGISKSKAAQARPQLVAEGLLTRKGKGYQLGPKNLLAERLSSGYAQVLRPKLLVGRFRFAEKTAELFLTRLRNSMPSGVRYALTGGPAVDLLQHFYRGPEVPMFLEPSSRRIAQELRLLPDSEGPVTLLRAFGEVVFWQERDHHMLAPPWLIYAELLNSNDPRAHEAAREFQQELSL